jgi:general secretion pathway protein G
MADMKEYQFRNYLRPYNNYSVGFTLIELLVVIAIISLLSSAVLASLSGARESARDSSRYQDFRQIRQAVNQYRNQEGEWPGTNSGNEVVSKNCNSKDIYQDLVGGGYLSEMPTDPSESVDCGGLGGQDGENEFYYGWDNEDNDPAGKKEKACFGINNFESSNDAGELEDLNHLNEFDGGGGGGSLHDGNVDFIYCFDVNE